MKIVALCPSWTTTGGTEALHQLVDAARRLGHDGSILYYPDRLAAVQPAYAHYDVSVVSSVPDTPGTLVVVPEAAPSLPVFRFARRAFWWLSVDNFFATHGYGVPSPGEDAPALAPFTDPSVEHLTQSHYARTFLFSRGIRSSMLTDYLSDAFFRNADARTGRPRRDVILYNPRKGVEVTQRVMAAAGDRFSFVPIQGLDEAGVADLLSTAKLYIDFGEHPGRDRIPREAAVSGCAVITGSRGSAGNAVDVPIPERFRLDERDPGFVDRFLALAGTVLGDFSSVSAEFEPYRQWVRGQKDAFFTEVAELCARAPRRGRQPQSGGPRRLARAGR